MNNISDETSVRPAMIWDLIIRLSGIGLFVLLVVAYATGDEFPHTHVMIGYAIAALTVAGIVWALIRPHDARFSHIEYSPRAIKARFVSAGTAPKALVSMLLFLATLPLCALLIIFLTHTVWGTTWIDEMHEVVAYFVVGLVVFYIAMVGIAGSGNVENIIRRIRSGTRHPS